MNLNSPHLATGQACPPLVPGSLRIYNMRFCPYAQRALLAAAAKGIKFDVVNVNLILKPEFLFTKNPEGKVPTTETNDGKVLYESLIVADYIDEEYNSPAPGGGDTAPRKLNAKEPYQRALDRIWIERCNKIAVLDYRISVQTDIDSEGIKDLMKQLNQELLAFEAELKRRGTKYFLGQDKPGMLDYMIWPWFERIPCFGLVHKNEGSILEEGRKQIPTLVEWENAMLQDEAVKAIYLAPEHHAEYRFMRRSGGTINYDFLITQ